MSNKGDERLRKTTIAFLKDFAEQGYENAVECIDWLEKQDESDETKAKIFLINKGYPIDANGVFPTYKELCNIIREGFEKQNEQNPTNKEYTFKAIPRLLEMIQQTYKAKSYCQKLIDSFEQEGYIADANIVRDCLKQMNGEKVAMATMDEQESTDNV